MTTLVALADPMATAALDAMEHEAERPTSPQSNVAETLAWAVPVASIGDTLADHMATAVLGAKEHAAESSALRLCDLPVDVLEELYVRVPFQFVLKLVSSSAHKRSRRAKTVFTA